MSMSRVAGGSAQWDVILDSIVWSGGNTTLEALAQDLPVVTFEGELMRGRVSAGMLRMMGMPETIAGTIDDYVALGCVSLATPPGGRNCGPVSRPTASGSIATAPASPAWKPSLSA